MSAMRFSWKGVTAVVLCSIVFSTADRLFAQLNMEDFSRTVVPLPGSDAWPLPGLPQAPAAGIAPTYPSAMPPMPERPDLAVYPSDAMPTSRPPLPEFQGMPAGDRAAPPLWEEPIEEERIALPQPTDDDNVIAAPVVVPEQSSAVPAPVRHERDEETVMPSMADSATREIIQGLAEKLRVEHEENAALLQKNEQLELELYELQSLVRQLQDAISSLSPSSQQPHGAAEEVLPGEGGLMRGEEEQDTTEWPSDAETEAGETAEPFSAESGVFGRVLHWFGF